MTKLKSARSPEGVQLRSYLGNLMASEPEAASRSLEAGRRAIWYELTALEQEISHWSSKQSPRDARVMADLLKDVWAIWDREWKTASSTPLLLVNILERISDRASSTGVSQRVVSLRLLIEPQGHNMPHSK